MKVYCLVDTYDLKTRYGEFKLNYGFNDIPDRQEEIDSVPLRVIAPSLSSIEGALLSTSADPRILISDDLPFMRRYKILGLLLNGCTIRIRRNPNQGGPSVNEVYLFKADCVKLTQDRIKLVNSAPNAGSQEILSVECDPGTSNACFTITVGSNVVINGFHPIIGFS